MDQSNLLELFQVTCLMQGFLNYGRAFPRVMFVAGRAQGDDQELIYAAGMWLKRYQHVNSCIVFPGHDGSYADGQRVATGYPGFDNWRDRILRFGQNTLPYEVLPCVVRAGHEKITHTREETDGFVLRAQERGWQSAFVMAHAHQLPRLMACILKSMEELQYPMDVYPKLPEKDSYCQNEASTDWQKVVYGSLGQQSKARWQHIEEELNRILSYQEKGWMVPLAKLRDYLLRQNTPPNGVQEMD